MSICSRFAVAVHILAVLHMLRHDRPTSERVADSVGTNPVVIRRIIGQLARSGLVKAQAGVGGTMLLRPVGAVSLLEIYRAVEAVDEEGLFALHQNPNSDCPVGKNIQSTLTEVFGRAQTVMEKMLAAVTLADVIEGLEEKQAKPSEGVLR